MLVFAWILWISFIVYFSIRLVLFLGQAMADKHPSPYDPDYAEVEKIQLTIRPINTILKIAMFVFLTIFIFF